MQPTRWEILQLLKRRGRATVLELSQALRMTLMGVRLHLVVVERDGYVRRSTVRDKPGRPALVYSLTPKAEELFPKRYALLAEKLLQSVSHGEPSGGLDSILEEVAHGMAQIATPFSVNEPLVERVERVSRHMDEEGSFCEWEGADGGFLIRTHNCLFYRVAMQNRDVCRIDELMLKEMLGVDVERRGCLLDGNGECSFFVADGPRRQDEVPASVEAEG